MTVVVALFAVQTHAEVQNSQTEQWADSTVRTITVEALVVGGASVTPAPTQPAVAETVAPEVQPADMLLVLPVPPPEPAFIWTVEQWRGLVCSYAWNCNTALCIIQRESRGDPGAGPSATGDRGLFQINQQWADGNPDYWTHWWDPVWSTQMAWYIYAEHRNGLGWQPWSTRHSC